ncbi:MAG: threonine dehydratase [Telluria sp.]
MPLPALPSIEAAARTVYAGMPPTPQYSWPLLNEALGLQAWVKHENHTPVGAFKVRGGLVYLDRLAQRLPGLKGIVSATRGNHGQSLAFAARRAGVAATIVVPHGNSTEKNAAMRGLGATLIEHGRDFDESRDHARMLAQEHGLHIVPSYHEDLVAGVATAYLEFLRAQPALDVLMVPIGQGSGICAALAARAALGLETRIIGVVSAHARAFELSYAAGRPVEAPVDTVLADGMACRTADPAALADMLGQLDRIVSVTDDEVARAMRLYFRTTHNAAEGAGAAPLAAALRLQEELQGRRIGLPLTGANVDTALYRRVLQGD